MLQSYWLKQVTLVVAQSILLPPSECLCYSNAYVIIWIRKSRLELGLIRWDLYANIPGEHPTCDCWTPECGYCSSMECTVKQDLFNSDVGIVVTSQIYWKTYNTIVLYNEDGLRISELKFSLKEIILEGCATCKTPPALKDVSKEKYSTWAISLKGGLFKITVEGEVMYERQLPEECDNIYLKAKRYSFSQMSCQNTFTFAPNDMKAGKRMTPDCGGSCPLQE